MSDPQHHTVEKIGGTSMADWPSCRNNIFLRDPKQLYQRIFVVSAYAGVTNLLLEHKKTSTPGVYALFANNDTDWAWGDKLNDVSQYLCEINAKLFEDPLLLNQANQFVYERVEGVRSVLMDLQRLCSYGHFQLANHLLTVREMLSAIGEAQSAWNTVELLKLEGVRARFVDLSGWRESDCFSLSEKIARSIQGIDLSQELPIVTGYCHCQEGLMKSYDRGYSEITFSALAVVSKAKEAIIHKEYHLSSADPKLVGEEKVEPIGSTNYDVADQLSNLGMEAIHPRAAQGLRQNDIPLRIKNTFEPEHQGTLITSDYRSQTPRVEIIAGQESVYALSVFDQEMVGSKGYEEKILQTVHRFKAKPVGKDMNANCIVQYLDSNLKNMRRVEQELQQQLPQADISWQKLAMVAAIGSDLAVPGMLLRCVQSLSKAGINILAIHQCPRQVDIRFVVAEEDYKATVSHLHQALVEQQLAKSNDSTDKPKASKSHQAA